MITLLIFYNFDIYQKIKKAFLTLWFSRRDRQCSLVDWRVVARWDPRPWHRRLPRKLCPTDSINNSLHLPKYFRKNYLDTFCFFSVISIGSPSEYFSAASHEFSNSNLASSSSDQSHVHWPRLPFLFLFSSVTQSWAIAALPMGCGPSKGNEVENAKAREIDALLRTEADRGSRIYKLLLLGILILIRIFYAREGGPRVLRGWMASGSVLWSTALSRCPCPALPNDFFAKY